MSIRIDPNEVYVIVPAFNENAVITSVISDLLTHDYNVLVVDDGSEISLGTLLNKYPVTVLRHSVNLGQGAALQTGIEFALSRGAKYVVTFDADGQHLASDIAKLLEPLVNEEMDITIGSRFMKGSQHNMTGRRKLTIKIARLINFFFTGLMLSDAYNGLRALNSKAVMFVQIQENGMAHATELLAMIKKFKLRYKEIPVNIRYTEYSRKKGLTIWNGFRIFFDILLNKIFK
jgi:glycosyltransferase involved in cell wall biosynthesis